MIIQLGMFYSHFPSLGVISTTPPGAAVMLILDSSSATSIRDQRKFFAGKTTIYPDKRSRENFKGWCRSVLRQMNPA